MIQTALKTDRSWETARIFSPRGNASTVNKPIMPTTIGLSITRFYLALYPLPNSLGWLRVSQRMAVSRSKILSGGIRQKPAIVGLLILFYSSFSFGQTEVEIHFRNGDRITGELIDRAEGKIYFRSPILGTLVIPESDAAIVERPEISAEALTGLPPESSPPPRQSPATEASPAPSSSRSDTSTPQVASTAPTPAVVTPEKPKWKGKVEFGFAQKSGRSDALTLSLRADAEKKTPENDYLASSRYLYGEQNNVLNSDRIDASFRWRHDLTERLFSQNTTSYYRDRISSIDHNIEQNASLGYRLFDLPRHILNFGGGLTARYRVDLVDDSGITGLFEVFEDYTYKINGRFTLTQNAKGQYSPQNRGSVGSGTGPSSTVDPEAENYKFLFNATLQGKVTENISMNIRLEYEFDNAIANREAKVDQRITSSIGYAF